VLEERVVYTGLVSACIGFPMNSGRAEVRVGRGIDVYRAQCSRYWVPNIFRESWGVCWKREWHIIYTGSLSEDIGCPNMQRELGCVMRESVFCIEPLSE